MTTQTTRQPPPRSMTAALSGLPVTRLTLAALVCLALVGVGVFPQLTARLSGDEYLLRVAPLDPIDPFRGAYVALDYPDLPDPDRSVVPGADIPARTVFIPLSQQGEVWVGRTPTQSRPADGPYLACNGQGFMRECGIESWFLPQDDAAALEQSVRDGTAIAVVRIDGRGNAALVDIQTG